MSAALMSPPPAQGRRSEPVSPSSLTGDFSDVAAVAGPHQTGPISSQAGPVSFTIPTPPSANHLFKNVPGKGRVKSHHYDDFLRMAVVAIRRQKVGRVAGNVVLIMGVERMSGQADIDNRLKAALDAIVTAGVIDDDRFITGLAVAWLPKANGLAHIQIHQVKQIDLSFHPSQNGACGGWFLTAPSNQEDECS